MANRNETMRSSVAGRTAKKRTGTAGHEPTRSINVADKLGMPTLETWLFDTLRKVRVTMDAVRDIAVESGRLHRVIDVAVFNATVAGERVVPDEKLSALIQMIHQHQIGRGRRGTTHHPPGVWIPVAEVCPREAPIGRSIL